MKTNVRKNIEQEWAKHPFLRFSEHPSLKALSVCSGFLGEDDDCDFNELVFAVPKDWLIEACKAEFEGIQTANDVQYWLENLYTSDESYIIFRLAMEENQIVVLAFN